MQSLVTYSLCHTAADDASAAVLMDNCSDRVNAWLDKKGARGVDGTLKLERGSRTARLESASYPSSMGRVAEWHLTEPLENAPGGEFRTTVQLAAARNCVHLYATLKAGYVETRIAPEAPVQVRPPRVLFDLADAPHARWCVGPTPLGLEPIRWFGSAGAAQLIGQLENAERRLPLVVVSDYKGLLLHPGLDADLARDLYGLAQVGRLDEAASWELARQLGREWACYHGAVRIYWPGLRRYHNPFAHKLWTTERIMEGHPLDATRVATRAFLADLFRELRRLSTFSVRCPTVFPALRSRSHLERLAELREQATDEKSAQELLAEYDRENRQLTDEARELNDELARLREENDRLKTDVENERAMRTVAGRAAPATTAQESPVATVAEAVERARARFAKELAFGADVNSEVEQLEEDAGPPDKVFTYLGKLAEAARALQEAHKATGSASLGTPIPTWLTGKGANSTAEKAQTLKNPDAKKSRTWDFGNGTDIVYSLHMKPVEAQPRPRCVRIYFEWCDKRKKIVVGSVGPHPNP